MKIIRAKFKKLNNKLGGKAIRGLATFGKITDYNPVEYTAKSGVENFQLADIAFVDIYGVIHKMSAALPSKIADDHSFNMWDTIVIEGHKGKNANGKSVMYLTILGPYDIGYKFVNENDFVLGGGKPILTQVITEKTNNTIFMKLVLKEKLESNFAVQFKEPFKVLHELEKIKNPNVEGKYTQSAKSLKKYHRKTILKQGRTNFEEGFEELNAKEMVDLYCFYYFQMHYTSSFVIYFNELEFISQELQKNEVWFIDIGCGPFTSGYAFNTFLNKIKTNKPKSLNYIGIDRSKAMIDRAKFVEKNMIVNRFNHSSFTTDLFEVSKKFNTLLDDSEDTLFIINYSYVFASHTLKVSDLTRFTFKLLDYFNKKNHKLIVLQQNPKLPSLNKKWVSYKEKLNDRLTNLEGYPKNFNFSYEDAFGSCNRPTMKLTSRCDILKSF